MPEHAHYCCPDANALRAEIDAKQRALDALATERETFKVAARLRDQDIKGLRALVEKQEAAPANLQRAERERDAALARADRSEAEFVRMKAAYANAIEQTGLMSDEMRRDRNRADARVAELEAEIKYTLAEHKLEINATECIVSRCGAIGNPGTPHKPYCYLTNGRVLTPPQPAEQPQPSPEHRQCDCGGFNFADESWCIGCLQCVDDCECAEFKPAGLPQYPADTVPATHDQGVGRVDVASLPRPWEQAPTTDATAHVPDNQCPIPGCGVPKLTNTIICNACWEAMPADRQRGLQSCRGNAVIKNDFRRWNELVCQIAAWRVQQGPEQGREVCDG